MLCSCVNTGRYVTLACRHKTYISAIAWEEQTGEPVKIAVGKSTINKNEYHSQAFITPNGRVVFLSVGNQKVYEDEQDWWFNIDYVMSPEEFRKNWFKK